ncbi:MAG: AAA family ATPase, partial [Erysipelotrichaceae bacterium]
MKKAIVLLAGYPGTGKSYLCDKIMKKESDFNIVSLDEIKEAMFDEVGCNNLEEKEMVINQSWEEYYHVMEDNMIKGLRIISDYPFSEKQKNRIDTLAKKYDYERITIRLVADIDVLYERQRKRDLDPNRHLSHIVSHYH